MKVLFITTSFPSVENPASGVFVLEHARAVSPHAEVAVLHLDRRHDARGIRVSRDQDSEFPTWRVSYPHRPTGLSIAAHTLAGIAGYRAVRRAGFAPDLIHAHFFLAALPAALIAKATRTPLVETEQWTIFLPEDPARLTASLKLGARLALSAARMVMPVSANLEREMAAAGVRGPFRVVPNAVDTSSFRVGPGGGGLRLATVSMLNAQKGVDILLRAIARVREVHPGVRLEIAGDGPDRAYLERLTDELGVRDNVVFHGLLPKNAIADILARSDLFVLASRFDNNPCVLIEAQAAGLPIVSTRVGGIHEIVDSNGALVQRDDVDGLAAAILETLSELERFDRTVIAASAAERYSFDAVGNAFADVYREVTTG